MRLQQLRSWGFFLFQKPENLSNTFFQWLPLEFLIPGRRSGLSRQAKAMPPKDLKENYELFADVSHKTK
jgi:hypothetical protein